MQPVKLVRALLLPILFSSVVLAACGPSAPTATPTQAQPSAPTAAPTQAPASSPTPAGELVTQASQIVGVWTVYNDHCDTGYMLIRPDGTFTVACSQDGSHGITSKYSLENGQFLTQSDICQGGQFEAHVLNVGGQPKSLVFTVIKDDCAAEVEMLTKQPLVWVAALP